MKRSVFLFAYSFMVSVCFAQKDSAYKELWRPQIHFSPQQHWINDPNGMVYNNGIYHLFFQYYPDGNVWGPMHWGHAISKDLIHWQQQPIALYPDSLGYIFSGSAVVDKNNTSGFGKDGKAPLVAIFTHHDPVGEKAGTNNFQNQSIAYSNDDGKTWTKYHGNPVLKNPGITDFRDPKVMWYEAEKKWVMTLATKDHITFYSSPDLQSWSKESEFGKDIGAHGGVWECPDLFSIEDDGKIVWVLIVNLNPGGPNGGSATQYFMGDFDGKTFTPFNNEAKWLDYGPDEYAGITWSNTGDRKIFLGWMSNWLYANVVPTTIWRNAMTLPRELKLKHVNNNMFLSSVPVEELNAIASKPIVFTNANIDKIELPCKLNFVFNEANDFSIVLSNDKGEETAVGFDKAQNHFFIDRSKSGKTDFQKEFAEKHFAPRISNAETMNVTLVIDISSVELFADDGLSVMTEIFFPSMPYNHIKIHSAENTPVKSLEYINLKSIWNK